MASKLLIRQRRILVYTAIGAVGFLVEAIVLTELIKTGLALPMTGRFVSFPAAVLVTWGLNRIVTFNSKARIAGEMAKYVFTQTLGALVNLCTYWISIQMMPVLATVPVVALGIGAVAGLVVNYSLSSLWVFRSCASHG